MRMGKCSIKESFIHIENGEVILYGMHISPYEKGNIFNKDPLRPRKLLMHKKEIQKMVGKIAQKGYTIVPVEVYFKGSLVKVQVALAKGKKLYDKRQDIAKKDQRREPNGISKCGILDRCFAKNRREARVIFLLRKNITGASNGFDRDHAAGEASRTGYVKFHN